MLLLPAVGNLAAVDGSIGVLEALDNPISLAQADCFTWDENALPVWTLRISGYPIEGR